MSGLLPRRARRGAAFGFIMATILLDMLAMAIVLPVLPKLIQGLVRGDTVVAAHVFGLFGAAWAAMQFITAPVLGALSDRYGRRPVILLSCLGQAADFVVMALAPDVAWLLVGRMLSGASSANIAAANAYIADVTPAERRAAAFGISGVAAALGFVLGPALGGILGGVSLRLPFWFAAGLALANFIYGWVALPESLSKRARTRLTWRGLNPLSALAFYLRPGIAAPATIYALGTLALQAIPSVLVLYVQDRFGWIPLKIGLTLAAAGIGFALVGGLLVGPVVKRFGEVRTLILGLLLGAAGFGVFGFAPRSLIFWAGVPVISFWALAMPSVQGIMAHRVSGAAQGRLQGLLSSLSGLTALIGPLLFTAIYAKCLGPGGSALVWTAGLPLVTAGGLLLVSMLPILRLGNVVPAASPRACVSRERRQADR
ncbi:MFS transporter [Acidiphilium acidophilum]|uniref:MFS transporter n=1 Tax=Acidiphilium acidophilum TaxID=76588 RepID=UPI002E8E6758|nr:MFS transporter [Acidiphilium acidophilum]